VERKKLNMKVHQWRLWQVSLGALSIAASLFIFLFFVPALQPAAAQSTNPFDALYPLTFRLRALAAEAIPVVARPRAKASGLNQPSYIDPVYNTRVYRVSAATDFAGADFVRHDYSRRQAFNANQSRFIALTSDGYWLLYDANTFQVLRRTGHQGALQGMAGDCEAIWHPTDPTKLWYTSYGGSLRWYEKNVETDTDTLLVDFTGRLPWPRAQSVWTKSEGTSSADGRYWALMATAYDDATQTNTIYGLFTWDRQLDRIIGTYDAANFGGAFPDHISISPSGRYVVPSWAFNRTLGTRAYPLDFSSSIQLNRDSEHSDLAIGPNGEDYYVATDYDGRGTLRAVNIATGVSFDLLSLYPVSGEGYAAHISGKAYDRPGWVVISTYADGADYGNLQPAPTLRPMYRKIMLVELKPGGRQYSVAHTRTGANYGGYWGEPQATISRDGARILFASNFDDGGPPNLYMIGLPSWVYGDSAPATPTATPTSITPPTPTQTPTPLPAAITISVDAIPDSIQNFRFTGDLGSFALDDANPDDGDLIRRTRAVSRPAGVYAITPSVPTGWFVTVACTPAPNAQIDATGQVILTVAAGNAVACTFTYQRGGHIYTRAFNDRNGDWRRQFNEPWLTGWTMTVYNAQGALVGNGQTNSLGKANFIHLRPAFYTVCTALPPGWQSTLPGTTDPSYQQPCYAVIIAPNQTATMTFGNRQLTTAGSVDPDPIGSLPNAGIVLHDNGDVPTDDMGYDGNLWVDRDIDQPVLDQPVYLPLVQSGPQ
jgi:hypothetical protein